MPSQSEGWGTERGERGLNPLRFHQPQFNQPEPIHTVIMILSCEAYRNRAEACRETWLSHPLPPGCKAIFLVGRPGQENILAGDMLYLDCPDTYLGLPLKVWMGIRECLVRWDFRWLFKTDDDSMVNPYRVVEYPKSADYMGRRILPSLGGVDWHKRVVPLKEKTGKFDYHLAESLGSQGPQGMGWAGGMGYFLSRRACQLVATEPLRHVKKDLYEDRLVGEIMSSYGIYLHGRHNTIRPIGEGSIFGATCLHPLDPDEMRSIYWRLLRAGEFGT